MRCPGLVLLLMAAWGTFAFGANREARYLGPDTCALCHKAIAAQQRQTAMANTWQSGSTNWLPNAFRAEISEDLPYTLARENNSFRYSVELPGSGKVTLPADILMGGRRHGLGFLLSIKELDAVPLARPALVQARHAWSTDRKKLLLAPGCVRDTPQTVEAALGLTLSPSFEARCLACHGQPELAGSGKSGGVHCESCHGPGSAHLEAVGKGQPSHGVVNPSRLSNEQSIEVCARCHVGLSRYADPSGDDLLVANQARAIRSSECYLQSGKAFSCVTCHDPHKDGSGNQQAEMACMGCHSEKVARHAAVCPVNASTGCVACHMPSVEMGPLHLVDHLIRVHPQGSLAKQGIRSQVRPVSEYLRQIVTDSAEKAAQAERRIAGGEAFYGVARELSLDPSAAIGGYLGRRNVSELGEVLSEAAGRLQYGETSPVLERTGRWFVLQRMPRDFRWQAEQEQQQAESLLSPGDARAAIGKAQQALMIYPQFLRSLLFIGTTFAQNGNARKAADVLAAAAKLYPDDAATQFELGAVREMLNDKAGAAAAYKRAIALDADVTAAYASLGMISYTSSDWKAAIATFRAGLLIDPLSAELYYKLGLALGRSGDLNGAAEANLLARKLEPGIDQRMNGSLEK